MTTRVSRAAVAATTLALLLLPLAACSSGASTAEVEDPPATAESEPADDAGADDDTAAASGEMYGCTEAVLAYANEYGYPNATPLDPATLQIPSVSFDVAPDCYVVDDYGGAERYGAFWSSDPQGVLTSLGAALDAAGYEQADEWGPLVWWLNGDDPTRAEVAVAAAPQPVDGVDMLWATW
jgi:hypothetical protein